MILPRRAADAEAGHGGAARQPRPGGGGEAAAAPRSCCTTGPALVFDSIEDLRARIDDPDLDVTPDYGAGAARLRPGGYPGMPEVGNMPLPRKLLEQGVRDMVRISDARMSGTAFDTVLLHAAPESTVGGPLAIVRTGDLDHARRARPPASAGCQRRRDRPRREPIGGCHRTPRRTRLVPPLHRSRRRRPTPAAILDFLIGASGSKVSP